MAEWLRRVIRNHLGSSRAGSNPVQCDLLLIPPNRLTPTMNVSTPRLTSCFSSISLNFDFFSSIDIVVDVLVHIFGSIPTVLTNGRSSLSIFQILNLSKLIKSKTFFFVFILSTKNIIPVKCGYFGQIRSIEPPFRFRYEIAFFFHMAHSMA